MNKNLILITILLAGFFSQVHGQISYAQQLKKISLIENTDSLYRGNNYEHYNKIYKRATTLKRSGIFLTCLGSGMFITGVLLSGSDLERGAPLGLTGFAVANVGAVMWIAGSVKRKNNKMAMDHIRSNTSLSFGVSHNGIGLTLHL